MTNLTPFVQRHSKIYPRRWGYSTALTSRYEALAGLYDKSHGQHTMILITYE